MFVRRLQWRQMSTVVELGGGINGCNNRFPIPEKPIDVSSLTITDPLVIYKNYVSRGVLRPDPQQLRAAIEFQKLYLRVKDYQPVEATSIKIKSLVRKIEQNIEFTHNDGYKKFGLFRPRWFDSRPDKRELVRVLSDTEEIAQIASPQGLLINGPVGSGKSLLMDIFASSLPHESKCRWHYNNFILWVYSEIHLIQKRRLVSNQENHSYLSLENEFILFEILQKMISKNTVLLLDEFMLPDIAAAKIVKILFTYFFKLGGVLVATSNRLPEELYSTDFNRTQFKGFLDILKLRCHSYDMNSDKDYRKLLSDEAVGELEPHLVVKNGSNDLQWDSLVSSVLNGHSWSNDELVVYGRHIHIEKHCNGVVMFDFAEICQGEHGPGDYISILSNYHTVILDNVPAMTLKMKNEARRFITLLDAIYESKCRLIMRSDHHLDQLFFPDATKEDDSLTNNESVQNEEMFSKTQIAISNPYRPNISSYNEGSNEYQTKKSEKTDFQNFKKFTGEDEMFAYKRAVSRISEMTGSPTWRQIGKWTPMDPSMRPWENQTEHTFEYVSGSNQEYLNSKASRAFEVAPSIKDVHIWALGLWNQTTRYKDDITRRWIKAYK